MRGDLTTGPITRTMLLFALPMMAGNLLQQCYNVADTLIVGGTSLVVYPAAGLIDYFNGKHLIVVNLSPTAKDARAELVLPMKIGETFSSL